MKRQPTDLTSVLLRPVEIAVVSRQMGYLTLVCFTPVSGHPGSIGSVLSMAAMCHFETSPKIEEDKKPAVAG